MVVGRSTDGQVVRRALHLHCNALVETKPKSTLSSYFRHVADLNMMVMMAQVLVVAMDIPMRSLRISHTQSLISASPVVRASRMHPQEMGSLSADDI